MKNSWFIPGEVPSSKNSKQILRTKTGRWFIGSSKPSLAYKTTRGILYVNMKNSFRKAVDSLGDNPYPLTVDFLFIRKTKRAFDYNNISQMVQDMMVVHGVIPDDSCNYLIPHFSGFEVNPKNPGVIIKILKNGKKNDI